MTKKRSLLLVCIVVILLTATVQIAVNAFSMQEQEEEIYKKLGRIETQNGIAPASEDGIIAYTGDHIVIRADDLERYQQRGQLLTGKDDYSEEALRNLAVREVFCYLAQEAGIPNDDEAFAAWLAEYRRGIENASNYSDFEAFAKGAGMTEEEYWNWAASSESFRKEYYATLFSQKLREDYKAQCTIAPGTEEYQKAWIDFFDQFKDEAVKNEHLKKANETQP